MLAYFVTNQVVKVYILSQTIRLFQLFLKNNNLATIAMQ